jgi:hypothetical protein
MLHLKNSPVVISFRGTSGTSSAKTTAKPLRRHKCSSSARIRLEERNDELAQVPIDMAMEKPWTKVVSEESDGDIVTGISYVHDVTDDGIIKVVGRVPGAPDHME